MRRNQRGWTRSSMTCSSATTLSPLFPSRGFDRARLLEQLAGIGSNELVMPSRVTEISTFTAPS